MRLPRRTALFSQEEREERFLWMREAYDASLKPNSRKNMRSAIKGYMDFCSLMAYEAFPLSLQSVASYLADYVARGNSPNSITGIMCHLRRHCIEEYLPVAVRGGRGAASAPAQGPVPLGAETGHSKGGGLHAGGAPSFVRDGGGLAHQPR
jgi:hypothetical protein